MAFPASRGTRFNGHRAASVAGAQAACHAGRYYHPRYPWRGKLGKPMALLADVMALASP
ncbi:hypothetical protein [Pseudomonas veronii]|uniref:hypothetical protein n=1 Tax=Pseudomonas veronii TaxID=76761 RepID=UPI00143D7918|nr:hypothetical protein [Pseudomonas veronii]